MTGETRIFRFRIELDGEHLLWFQDASGLSMTEGEPAPSQPRKLPGVRKYINLTFRKGMTDSGQALTWIRAGSANLVRKTIRIALLGEDGGDTAVWQVQNAWPLKSAFSGDAIESLEIACEDSPRLV